tara:strand:- start:502 stop:813 length:312 start_codon:yes stop_codon:yes gene_type:complete
VVLEGLDQVEVGALTLREAVLAIELQLGDNDGILTPAVHVKGSLGKDEGARIRYTRISGRTSGVSRDSGTVIGEGILEEARCVNDTVRARDGLSTTEGMDRVG